jgi:hypothetical protein
MTEQISSISAIESYFDEEAGLQPLPIVLTRKRQGNALLSSAKQRASLNRCSVANVREISRA